MLGTLVFSQEAETPSFAPLLLVTALAAFIPLVTDRLKVLPVPVIVGEILVGILLGESGLGIIRESSYLSFLVEFGFVYLMFLSGLEIDFSSLRTTSSPNAAVARSATPSPWASPSSPAPSLWPF